MQGDALRYRVCMCDCASVKQDKSHRKNCEPFSSKRQRRKRKKNFFAVEFCKSRVFVGLLLQRFPFRTTQITSTRRGVMSASATQTL